MIPQFKKVESSNIYAIGYDGKDLYVRFMRSGMYKYNDVPKDVVTDLMDADSKGKFFNMNIKGSFEFEKVG